MAEAVGIVVGAAEAVVAETTGANAPVPVLIATRWNRKIRHHRRKSLQSPASIRHPRPRIPRGRHAAGSAKGCLTPKKKKSC